VRCVALGATERTRHPDNALELPLGTMDMKVGVGQSARVLRGHAPLTCAMAVLASEVVAAGCIGPRNAKIAGRFATAPYPPPDTVSERERWSSATTVLVRPSTAGVVNSASQRCSGGTS
jgi:hypothetical protein